MVPKTCQDAAEPRAVGLLPTSSARWNLNHEEVVGFRAKATLFP